MTEVTWHIRVGSRHTASVIAAHGLNSCGAWAWLLLGMGSSWTRDTTHDSWILNQESPVNHSSLKLAAKMHAFSGPLILKKIKYQPVI